MTLDGKMPGKACLQGGWTVPLPHKVWKAGPWKGSTKGGRLRGPERLGVFTSGFTSL